MAALLGVLILPAPAGAAAVELEWQAYDKGLALAKAQGKKAFVYFYADWCTYCKMMEKETFGDPEAAAYLKANFVLVRVNTDRAKKLARTYSAQALPTSWFLTPEGEKIKRIPGYAPVDFFMTAMKYIHSDAYKTMSFKDFKEKKP